MQAVDTTGGTNTLTFDAAGSDVWATGSVIESRSSEKQMLIFQQQVKLN